jgi:hypothetical protein
MGQVITLKRKAAPKKLELTDLSFVRDGKGIGSKGANRCFWHVTSSGSYTKDCEAGKALALEYLAFTQDQSLPLQWLVDDMKQVSGLEVGFLGSIGRAASVGAYWLKSNTGGLEALNQI